MIYERYIIDLDRENALLESQGISYGNSFTHRGFYMSVTGAETPEKARDYLLEEIERRGWKRREKWWQFWRPHFND